jgi:hypothetical protein
MSKARKGSIDRGKNIEHRTLNAEHRMGSRQPPPVHSTFDVGRSTFDVPIRKSGLFRAIWVAPLPETIDKYNHVHGR